MSVVYSDPITIQPPVPQGFVDIDQLVETEEQDPTAAAAIAQGSRRIADALYGKGVQPLCYYRLRNGWSQKAMAMRLGTSQSYIARLEAGEIDPQLSTLKRIAAIFGLPLDALAAALAAGR